VIFLCPIEPLVFLLETVSDLVAWPQIMSSRMTEGPFQLTFLLVDSVLPRILQVTRFRFR
jgi:hypothetical protein